MRDNYFLLCSLKDTHCTDNSIHSYLLLFFTGVANFPPGGKCYTRNSYSPRGQRKYAFHTFPTLDVDFFHAFFSFQDRNIGYKVYIHQMHVHLYINFNNPMSAILLMKSHRHTFTLVTA